MYANTEIGVVLLFEAEVIQGLESIAEDEIRSLGAEISTRGTGRFAFEYAGNPHDLLSLRAVMALYVPLFFAVPRPKALLGHQHFTRIVDAATWILNQQTGSFESLYIDAAGSHTAVMQRLRQELADALHLMPQADKGDLQVRIRRVEYGWDALLRLTPRPLVTRTWRVRNFEGALNATVAYAMVQLVAVPDARQIVNLACGSGSLLIEAALSLPGASVMGIDKAAQNLALAQDNLHAARVPVSLVQADLRALPLPAHSVDAFLADLPFGQRVGSHEDNKALYPQTLDQAARAAKADARFAVLTHEVRLMQAVLKAQTSWRLQDTIRINLRGLHPRIYLLQRLA